MAILSASITKPIDMGEYIHKGSAIKQAFGGATASQLNFYVHEILDDYKPDIIIINAGTNNFSKKKYQTPEEVTAEILEIVKTCKHGGVRKVFVSSITCRPFYQSKINEVNDLLQKYTRYHDYKYIDNACIREEHLKGDGIHLAKSGICILANNFLAHINRPSIFPFDNYLD